ncbi:MAG: hypothetical protein A3J51_01550 [Omnitrophica WOR_2 bacterium RIFCSPHIGHO2_02_FULL_45_21]|nr:MAG: hypothetical protein A3J51_01550 [Omnitrophica WOR_2 bacterium RIFCSPHIGHO2_02_FULL_45_21]
MNGDNADAASQNKEETRARNYVWRLIKGRLRSEEEIRQKLNLKKYAPPVIAKTVSYFKGLDYINDLEFARRWVNSRLRKPLGLKAIAIELKQKGVSKEIIDELIEQKKRVVDERRVVQELAEEYFDKLRGKKERPEKLKAKLYGYLLRRGFSTEVISDAINRCTSEV